MAAKTTSYEDMPLEDLRTYLEEVRLCFEAKREARCKELIAELRDWGGLPAGAAAIKKQGSANAGKPLPPKYRDPVTGDEWSGRGQMAKWLKDKVDAGETQDRYLVAAE